MLLGLAVIADAYKQEIVSILLHLGRILLAMYLVDGRVSILVHLQLKNDGRRIDILPWNQHNVGKTFAGSQFTVHDVIVPGIVVGDR